MTLEQNVSRRIRRSLNAGEDPKEIARQYGVRLQLVRDMMVKKRKHDKVRRCLSCDEYFLSEWSGNRICPLCKRRNMED